jgi:thiol-disulfide isomerase/thioredoxin
MNTGTTVLLAVVALATAFGCWRAVRDGTFRGSRRATEVPMSQDAAPVAGEGLDGLGERATLLQFSSAFCAPCRATRRVLGEVAGLVPGVAHVEVDAEEHLELVRRLGILRTPTTLVLDAAGREVSRASGAPSRDAVLATLGRTLDA